MAARGPTSPLPSSAALPTTAVSPLSVPAPRRSLPSSIEATMVPDLLVNGATPRSSMRGIGSVELPKDRVAMLEDEMSSMRRMMMLQLERSEIQSAGLNASFGGVGGARDGLSKTAGESTLWSVVTRLENEVQVERKFRMSVENKLVQLEEAINRERSSREAQFRTFSAELESNIRHLVGRLDETQNNLAANPTNGVTPMSGLTHTAPAGASTLPAPEPKAPSASEVTEARLRTLIKRVDEGLSAGVAALQDQLATPVSGSILTPSQDDLKHTGPGRVANKVESSPKGTTVQSPEAIPGPVAQVVGNTGSPNGTRSQGGNGNATTRVPAARSQSPVRGASVAAPKDSGSPMLKEQVVTEVDTMTSDQMIQSWHLLEQENKRLKEKKAQAWALKQRSPANPLAAPRSPAGASSMTAPIGLGERPRSPTTPGVHPAMGQTLAANPPGMGMTGPRSPTAVGAGPTSLTRAPAPTPMQVRIAPIRGAGNSTGRAL